MLLLPGEAIKHSSATTYDKGEGTLYFTTKRLAWCRAGAQVAAVEVLLENFRDQQVSKQGRKVKLKVEAAAAAAAGPAETVRPLSYIFQWEQEDEAVAIAERWKFVSELSPLSSRSAKDSGGGGGAVASPAPSAAAATSSEYSKVRIGAVPASAEEVMLRQEVLSKNGELAKVHKSLVVAGLVSEDEFWSTRKHILETYAIQSQLRKGETSSWLELTQMSQETGNFKSTITPNIARRIFREYPQVKRAYVDNVPHKVSEKTFWKRFIASQFFNRGRTGDTYKGRDSIFDKCSLEEDAAFSDSRQANLNFLARLLDLTRTEEDSMETGNAPDFTMRPSLADNKLPLIRRFNNRSQLVLQPMLSSKRKRTASSDRTPVARALEDATVLNDLELAPDEKRVRLNIHDRTRYFASLAKGDAAAEAAGARAADPEALRVSYDIARPLGGCGDTYKTMATMSSAAHRRTAQMRPNRIQELHIPDDVSAAIAECHGAGTEMLRHLWALLRLPPSPDRRQKAESIVVAFEGVNKHIRETIARASTAESKNARLGAMVEKMLLPIVESLRVGKRAFETQAAPRPVSS
ncbi:RNA polymerase II transcription factor B subunit 1 [Coemansia biformis]|uniref:RNA polymerase II transcription factor B subunit 1 n=1 Tax=Coemansia biformis TaxID=1286918 RepID=A0A9W7Y774_9FUNG|nr:RNA polymerase II transcription factor B subunit 1 [Coemansia biformis]